MATSYKKFLVDLDLNGNVIRSLKVESLSDSQAKDLVAADNIGRIFWNATNERLVSVVKSGNGYAWSTVASGDEIKTLTAAVQAITIKAGKGIHIDKAVDGTGTTVTVLLSKGTNILKVDDDGSLYVPDTVGTTNEVDVNLSTDGHTKTVGLNTEYKKSVTDGIAAAENRAKKYTDAITVNGKTKKVDSQNIEVLGSDTVLTDTGAYKAYELKTGESAIPDITSTDKVSEAVSKLDAKVKKDESDITSIRGTEIDAHIDDKLKTLKTVGTAAGTVVKSVSQTNGIVTVEYGDLDASQIKAGANNASTVAAEISRLDGKMPDITAGENIIVTPSTDSATGKTTYTIATDIAVFEFKGSVEKVEDLPGDATTGNTYFVNEKGILYSYSDKDHKWVPLGHPTDKVSAVDTTASHGINLTNSDQVHVGVTVTPGAVAKDDQSVVTGDAVNTAIANATAVGVVAHSYTATISLTANTAFQIKPDTHNCGR